MLAGFFKIVFRPRVRDRAGVRRYVAAVTLFAWIIAATADVVQRWAEGSLDGLAGQEIATLVVVLVIAVPISRTMGFAHLKLHYAQQEAERLSRTDPLTGLANRRAFYEHAAAFCGGTVGFVIADIDRFKRINDTHGHAAGDAVLVQVAQILRDELEPLGPLARLGGEEFGWLGPAKADADLRDLLQRLRQKIAQTRFEAGGERIEVTISVGWATGAGAGMDALYSAADRALYVAKAAGRDRVVAFADIDAALAAPQVQRAG